MLLPVLWMMQSSAYSVSSIPADVSGCSLCGCLRVESIIHLRCFDLVPLKSYVDFVALLCSFEAIVSV